MYFCVYPGVCCRIVINRSVSFSFFLFPPSPSFFSRSADFAPRYVHVRFLYLHDGDDVDALKPENSVNGETHTPLTSAGAERIVSRICRNVHPSSAGVGCYLMLIARGHFRGDITIGTPSHSAFHYFLSRSSSRTRPSSPTIT